MMTYEEWKKLTSEKKEQVPNEELPVIPKEQLRNGLISSRMLRTEDRALMWEIIQETPQGKETARYPEETTKTVWNKPLNYTFNPLNGCYSLNYRSPEPTMEEQPIGIYGLRWMEFMQKNHEIEVEVMMMDHKFRTVARRVDEEAENYNEILFNQYAAENPRPHQFEEILKWEEARQFYVESSVMRDVVLKMRTE